MKKDTSLHKGLRVLKALRGHAINGISNRQLAQVTGLSASTITRVMQTLIDEGFAQKTADGRFTPGVVFLQHAQSFWNECKTTHDRINELEQRVAAGARQ